MEIYLFWAVLLGLVPAYVAQSKGHRFGVWWLYGALLFIVALPHAMLLQQQPKEIERARLASDSKKCPFCAEVIKREAVVCRYCGRDVPSQTMEEVAVPQPSVWVSSPTAAQRRRTILGASLITAITLVLIGVACWYNLGAPADHFGDVKRAANSDQIFDHVDLLLKAASPQLPVPEWKQGRTSGAYTGDTGDVKVSGTGAPPFSTIDYCVSGYVEQRVAEAAISVLVTRRSDLPLARSRLTSVAEQWFRSTNLTPPLGFYEAIANDRAFEGASGGVSVQYSLDFCSEHPIERPAGVLSHCTLMEVTLNPSGGQWPERSCRYRNRQS